ncbi:cytochrome P450 [Bacillus sp. RAR_GA_16]|uniref:cytochrome P450 n=1 Tax=Bacillus sp. RAR_GA_16 TaxID=2876774 RepID=UPI001CCD2EFD|nr:cytochrome P450 [Bacillus sp. RAR_GA_16]MCA0171937.1 cytochrome P450 [Bacillus sp. RAR_GA_16]
MSVEKLSGLRLKNYLSFRKDPLDFLSKTRDIADFVELGASSFVVHQPEAIKQILVSNAGSFQKGNSASLLSQTIGRGLLTSEGETHERQRKMLMPAFHKEKMNHYISIILQETKQYITGWDDGEVICISSEMMRLTLRIIMKTMFGQDISKKESIELVTAVTHIIEKSASDLFLPFPSPEFVPTKRNKQYKLGKSRLNELADQLIQNTPKGDHLLSLLQQTTYADGSPLSGEEVRSQILTMLIAGHETTANVLSWMWYELSKNEKIEQQLLKEWKEAGEVGSHQELTHLFFKETLRLYPAAWVILREAIAPVKLMGHQFKSGSSFLISPYILQRNPLFFENPEQFSLYRMKEKHEPFAYFPFGGGPRSCIGSQFATYEAQLIFSTIGRSFHLQQLHDDPVQAEPLVSLRIKGGLLMKVHKRK